MSAEILISGSLLTHVNFELNGKRLNEEKVTCQKKAAVLFK